jgi:hypothetical protein
VRMSRLRSHGGQGDPYPREFLRRILGNLKWWMWLGLSSKMHRTRGPGSQNMLKCGISGFRGQITRDDVFAT